MTDYACLACAAFFTEYPGQPCPECQAWNTIRMGKPDAIAAQLASRGPRPLGAEVATLARHRVGIGDVVDRMLGGDAHPGVVDGHAIMLVGAPGVGKTTLCLHVCDKARKPLFVSAEQPEEEIAARAKEIGVDTGRILFSSEIELGKIESMVATLKPSDVVVDSLACVWDAKGSAPGSSWAMKNAAHRLFDLAHATKATLWMIGHVNAKGRASGPMAAIHWSDVLLGFDLVPGDGQGRRKLHFPVPKKNRGGPTMGEATFTMGARGLAPAGLLEGLPGVARG